MSSISLNNPFNLVHCSMKYINTYCMASMLYHTFSLYSALWGCTLNAAFSFERIPVKRTFEVLERVQTRATRLVKLGKGLEDKSNEKWLRELEVFSLQDKKAWGTLVALCNYLKEGVVRWGWSLLTVNKR